jgi:hypothetical protein
MQLSLIYVLTIRVASFSRSKVACRYSSSSSKWDSQTSDGIGFRQTVTWHIPTEQLSKTGPSESVIARPRLQSPTCLPLCRSLLHTSSCLARIPRPPLASPRSAPAAPFPWPLLSLYTGRTREPRWGWACPVRRTPSAPRAPSADLRFAAPLPPVFGHAPW